MGMFDHVDFECICPVCGAKVSGFQSKDGPCELKILDPNEVSNFYTYCRSCDTWIEFERVVTNQLFPKPLYEMVYQGYDDSNQLTTHVVGVNPVDKWIAEVNQSSENGGEA